MRDKYADLIRARYPKIPRRVSGYNLDDLLPEKGFHVGRALGGTRGDVRDGAGGQAPPRPQPAATGPLWCSATRTSTRPATTCRRSWSRAVGLEGIDRVLFEDMEKKKMHPDDVKLLPDGHGWLLVEFGGDTSESPTPRPSG